MTRIDIVIEKVNKGMATVRMSREVYINKMRSHLNHGDHYLKVDDDLTQPFSVQIKEVLIKMANSCSIPEEIICVLVHDERKVSRFYILPNIHKPG